MLLTTIETVIVYRNDPTLVEFNVGLANEDPSLGIVCHPPPDDIIRVVRRSHSLSNTSTNALFGGTYAAYEALPAHLSSDIKMFARASSILLV